MSKKITKKALGAWGETRAERYLTRCGLTLVERNWFAPSGLGEIDLVMQEVDGTYVFVEVKTRRGTWPIEESVGSRKLARLSRLAGIWLSGQDGYSDYRIDVVGVSVPGSTWDRANYQWWQGVDR